MKPHKKKSHGVKSGKYGGHGNGAMRLAEQRPIHRFREVLVQPIVHLCLVVRRCSIMHEDEIRESRPSLHYRQKPLLQKFQIKSRRDIVVEENRSDNSLAPISCPYADSRGMERLFAILTWVYVTPIPKILIVYVTMDVKVSEKISLLKNSGLPTAKSKWEVARRTLTSQSIGRSFCESYTGEILRFKKYEKFYKWERKEKDENLQNSTNWSPRQHSIVASKCPWLRWGFSQNFLRTSLISVQTQLVFVFSLLFTLPVSMNLLN